MHGYVIGPSTFECNQLLIDRETNQIFRFQTVARYRVISQLFPALKDLPQPYVD
jgi:hypothetical protein